MTTRYITEKNIVFDSQDGEETILSSNGGLIVRSPKAGVYCNLGFTAPIVQTGVWKFPNGALESSNLEKFTINDNELIYTGMGTATFMCNYSVSIKGLHNGIYNFGISINGDDPLESTVNGMTLDTSIIRNISASFFVALKHNDSIKIAIQNPLTTDGYNLNQYFLSVI